PVRFGEVVKDEDELRKLLDPRSAELGEALELVRGREQMTLRVFGRVGAGAAAGSGAAAGAGTGTGTEAEGPGARYLAGLREAREWGRRAPEIDAIRPAIALLVRAERIERRAAPAASDPGASSIVTVYHLVGRGEGRLYREAVERAAPAAGAPRLSVSGPWPPYAFCREV